MVHPWLCFDVSGASGLCVAVAVAAGLGVEPGTPLRLDLPEVCAKEVVSPGEAYRALHVAQSGAEVEGAGRKPR